MINEVIISYLLNLNSGTINTMNALRPRTARGNFIVSGQQYGQSLLGSPLLYFPASTPSVNIGLIIAGLMVMKLPRLLRYPVLYAASHRNNSVTMWYWR